MDPFPKVSRKIPRAPPGAKRGYLRRLAILTRLRYLEETLVLILFDTVADYLDIHHAQTCKIYSHASNSKLRTRFAESSLTPTHHDCSIVSIHSQELVHK